ncbi:putative Ig domain-containing protein [Comamonas sp. JC664]
MPAGWSIGAETGVISGVPSEATTAQVTISVVDSANRGQEHKYHARH